MKNKTTQSMYHREVSEYLNTSKSHACELTHRKDFPVSRFSGAIWIPHELFQLWVQRQTFVPAQLAV